jgi:TetR/AcrR family transcriptional regulator, repressor for uid operon
MGQGGKEDAPASTDAREAQQQRILAAAMACFARSGFHKASMQDICAEAGMSAGNLYRYFRSKEAIIAAIAEAERVRNASLFEQLQRAEDPVRGLIELARCYLRDMNSRDAPMLCTEIIAEALRNPEIRTMFERNINEAHAACAHALRQGVAQGYVDPDLDVDVAVRMLMALGDGIVAHRVIADFMTDDRTEAVLEVMLERFLRPHAASLKTFTDPVSSQLAAAPLPTSA